MCRGNSSWRTNGQESCIGPECALGSRAVACHCLPFRCAGAFNLIASQEFPSQFEVGFGAAGTRVVQSDRLAVAWRLSQADVAGNDGLVNDLAKVLAESLSDLLGEVGAVVVHRQQDALDGKVRIVG